MSFSITDHRLVVIAVAFVVAPLVNKLLGPSAQLLGYKMREKFLHWVRYIQVSNG